MLHNVFLNFFSSRLDNIEQAEAFINTETGIISPKEI